jgi:STE24 endopeptidase
MSSDTQSAGSSTSAEPIDLSQEQTPAQREEARRYGRIHLALTIADMVVDVVYLGLMAFVFGPPIDAWLATFAPLAGDKSMLRLLSLFGIVIGLHILVSLPLSFYSGYIVEHQFGLSNQTFMRWVRNWSLGNILAVVLGAALNAGLFWIIWNTGSYWWLIAAAAFFVVSVALGQLAPVLFLPLFYKIEPLENAELLDRMKKTGRGDWPHDRRRVSNGDER